MTPVTIISMKPPMLINTRSFAGNGCVALNRATRADRQNLQHNSDANTSYDSSCGETAGVNHDESESQTCLANYDPMKQAHDLFARPEQALNLSRSIFQ